MRLPTKLRRLCALLLVTSLVASASAQAAWTNLTNAQTPRLGMDFASTFDEGRHVLVLFGGREETSSTAAATDVCFEWNHSTWTQRTFSVRPGPRSKHDMAFDAVRGVVVLSGGLDGGRLPDTWEYDGTNWVLRHTAGPNEDLYNHRMVFDAARGVVVRFGGGGAGGLKGDTHTWTGSSWQLRTSGGPSPREQHAMAYDRQRQRVVLFGGLGNSGLLGDTWEWNGVTWQQMSPSVSPSARREAGLAYTGSSRKLVLFGGYAASLRGDTWTWNGTAWSQLAATNPPPAMAYFEFDQDPSADSISLVRGQEFSSYYIAHYELRVPVTAPATFSTFGAGCPGSAGTPQLAAAVGSLPYVGAAFTVRLTNLTAGLFNPAFLMSGFSTTTWNGAPLPRDLQNLGLPGCTAWIAPEATELLQNLGGVAEKTWVIPAAPALVGIDFHVQGAVMDQTANQAGFALSNAGSVHIGQL